MVDYTDFKNGLTSANNYLDTKHHLSGTSALGNSALRAVAKAEYSFTLRELLCGVLSGNGVKLPNLQICLSANIKALLQIPSLQAELADALSQLDTTMNDFMDHTKLDSVLGRLNGVLAEAQNVANMINFCSAPVDPIAIPNILERAMGSFLGAGKNLINQIGNIAPDNVCACIGTGGGFNASVFQGGILGTIANNIGNINTGSLGQSVIDSIRADISGVASSVSNLISFENNINGAYALGGSQFATPDSGCNSEVGIMHNPNNGSIAANARLASSMKGLYDKLAGYPVTYRPGTSLGGTTGSVPISSSNPAIGDTTPIEYKNIFQLLFDDEFLALLDAADDPQSNVDNQIPVYDYCGTIIGYTTRIVQQEQQTSTGTTPTVPNSPGYLAGGLSTLSGTTSSSTETIASSTLTVTDGSGANVYIVNSESAQLALSTNSHDLVVRTDILTIFARLDTSIFTFGTMADYQQSSVTFSAFGNHVNDLTGVGFVAKDGTVAVARSIIGTASQITVINGSGSGGNPIIGLSNNPILPGTASVTIPIGNTNQRPSWSTQGMVRYNNVTNNVEAFFSDTNTWQDLATTEDINVHNFNIINIGTGVELYKQKNVSNEHEFRKINATGAISLTQNLDDITVTDTLTASNLGIGAELFKSRVANDLQFRKLTSANSSVTITQNTNDVDLIIPGVVNTTLTTSDAISTPVLFNNVALSPNTDKTWFFKIYVLAGRDTTKRAWQLQGVVQDNSDTESFVGAVSRIDYQRNTGESTITPWNNGGTYSAGIQVEYDMIIYESNTEITTGTPSSWTSPDTNSDWTVIDAGWNASVIINSNSMSIRVRGDAQPVNWSVKLEYVEL
jgi:hypothetical protein